MQIKQKKKKKTKQILELKQAERKITPNQELKLTSPTKKKIHKMQRKT